MSKRQLQIVRVRWLDTSTDLGWYKPDNLPQELASCLTLGYLVKKTPKHLIIAGSVALDETGEIEQWGDITIIATSSIVTVIEIAAEDLPATT